MKYFLSFCGYPRSGHTLVAAMLNANPNVLCSNQENFYGDVANLDKKTLIETIKKGSLSQFKSTISIQPVLKKEILVMGDKTGHRTVTVLDKSPQNLGMMKDIVGVPIKWIHVVRNPFDNLATWARLNYKNLIKNGQDATKHEQLDIVIHRYRELNETIVKLKRSEDILTVNHEYVITRMHNTLEEMANFLEISFDPNWRDNVRGTVWKKPRQTRKTIKWTIPQQKAVNQMIEEYPWLDGYVYGGCGRC